MYENSNPLVAKDTIIYHYEKTLFIWRRESLFKLNQNKDIVTTYICNNKIITNVHIYVEKVYTCIYNLLLFLRHHSRHLEHFIIHINLHLLSGKLSKYDI